MGEENVSEMQRKKVGEKGQQIGWGRSGSEVGFIWPITCFILLVFCPVGAFYFWTACEHYECSLSAPALAVINEEKTLEYIIQNEMPVPTAYAFKIYGIWVFFQYILAVYLPGPKGYGQRTPAGHVLEYNVNGMYAFMVTHVLFCICTFGLNLFPATIIADNWGPLLIATNCLGYVMAFFAFLKGIIAPTHADDVKRSGSAIYDFFMGIEHNPRLFGIDFKLFFNGRPGIEAWSLINISFAAAQYRDYGYVTNSMILMSLLQLSYIVDFFHNEDWYLRTIDIAHDHFGFYLAWGDCVWLPYMYTLQGFYLSKHPVLLSTNAFIFVAGVGLLGFMIFRLVNHQKDLFRATPEEKLSELRFFGKAPTWIDAVYNTGKDESISRKSRLLTAGWWGLSRHFNYVGDLLLSLAYCLCCGFDHLFPYFYIFWMTVLLVHRVYRDDDRCRSKYGEYWEEYCRTVPWKILPGVF